MLMQKFEIVFYLQKNIHFNDFLLKHFSFLLVIQASEI